MYDEPVTLHLAKSVAAGQLPFVDFYEHHSPLPWYVLAPLSRNYLWREQRLLIAIGGILALLGLFSLSYKLWGAKAGLFVLVLGAVSPLWQHQGNMIIHDSFLVMGLVLAFLAWWYALQHPENSVGWLFAGLCAGIVVLNKQTGVISALALGVGILVFTRSIKAIFFYILGGVFTVIPLVLLFRGQYEVLFNGLLGWNLAANAHLPPNPKLKPFLDDIFLANPVLWGGGMLVALLSLRYFRQRTEQGDARPLLAVSGLIVILVLGFNWFLSRQTFGQYYLQAIPPLILLTAYGLDMLVRRPFPPMAWAVIGIVFVYLGIINPLMNSIIPWTPDLEEKGAIAEWLRQEVGDEGIWEPWVYYAYLADMDFDFYYPFLSIHSVRNDPDLPTIDGRKHIPLEEYLEDNNINWIVVHHPLLPGLETFLGRIFTASEQDWQVVRSFQVTRYTSESGLQRHFWTPWWKPLTFNETVTVWYKHPGAREGGLVGEMQIRNPTDESHVMLEVRHPGGSDQFLLDESSYEGKQYALNWHQTGHAFFLSGEPVLLDHQSTSGESSHLLIDVIFSESSDHLSKNRYRLRIPENPYGGFMAGIIEIWQDQSWKALPETCEGQEPCAVVNLSALRYESLKNEIGDDTIQEN